MNTDTVNLITKVLCTEILKLHYSLDESMNESPLVLGLQVLYTPSMV